MTLSSIEGTLQPPASHEMCLFVGSFLIFIMILEDFALCLLSQGEKRKYITRKKLKSHCKLCLIKKVTFNFCVL